jgi:hypothetical protein
MFNPYLVQREKEMNRQQALARAERSRLARLAKGDRVSRRFHLLATVGGVFHRIKSLLTRERYAGWFERSTQNSSDPYRSGGGSDREWDPQRTSS